MKQPRKPLIRPGLSRSASALLGAVLLSLGASTHGASAVAFNDKTGQLGLAQNMPTVAEAEQLALLRCDGGKLMVSGDQKGYWAVSVSIPFLIDREKEPMVIGWSIGGDDPMQTARQAELDCKARGGIHANFNANTWKENDTKAPPRGTLRIVPPGKPPGAVPTSKPKTSPAMAGGIIDLIKTGASDQARQRLTQGATAGEEDGNGYTALMWAIRKGSADLIRDLLAQGADVNAQAKDGYTALMFAARRGQTDVIQLLLDAGADKSKRQSNGFTALDIAGGADATPALQSLLK